MNTLFVGSDKMAVTWENMCRSNRKIRTRKDLLGIKLSETNNHIKCVIDPFDPYYTPKGVIPDSKLTWAWILYLANCTAPSVKTWQDRLRWKLRLKLIEWGII